MLTLRHRPYTLALRHTFRLARGDSDERYNLFVELEHDGLIGRGEAAPIPRYAQDQASAAAAVETMVARWNRQRFDPRRFEGAVARVAVAGQPAAAAALDMALYDLAGKRLGVPLHELLGLDPAGAAITSLTLGMDDAETLARKVAEADAFPVLKVKMGTADDRAVIEAVRAVTDKPLWVDANEGWTLDGARARLPWLAERGVELVEQPLPAGKLAEMRALRADSPLPLIADESVGTLADIPRLAGAFDGINIKLMKCGGPGEALKMIAAARAHGLQVMLGCMVESSLAVTAAAQLSPLVDYADLDGNLLVANDPFTGVTVKQGRLRLPTDPGLGVRER